MTTKMVRVSFTVPPQLKADLNYLSARLGVTNSALVSQLLMPALADLRSMVELVPENPSEDDILRARGRSNELITRRLQSYRKLEGDLFDGRNM